MSEVVTNKWINGYSPELIEAVNDTLNYSKKNKSIGALLMLSLDTFPMILYSYDVGYLNKLLTKIHEAIESVVLDQGKVFYTGQDHFCIVLSQCEEQDIEIISSKITTILQHFSAENDGFSVHLSTSIGSARIHEDIESAEVILKKAYVALYRIKNKIGMNYSNYREAGKFYGNSKHKMSLASYIQNAIHKNSLRLAFQPIISSQTGKVMCYECLLRIVEDDGTIKSAGPFIPIAEELGFMEEIDQIVLHKVQEELVRNPSVVLAFNISNQTVDSNNWLKKAEELLKDSSIASRAIIEITETGIQRDLRTIAYFVASLQSLGCQVALDDFGAGYTSFKQLKALPVDIIKIDGSFVQNMVTNSDNRLFVETLLNFTNSFGLRTVAEYVENGEIAKSLMDMNVDYLQGHYFSPAVNHRPWVCEGPDDENSLLL